MDILTKIENALGNDLTRIESDFFLAELRQPESSRETLYKGLFDAAEPGYKCELVAVPVHFDYCKYLQNAGIAISPQIQSLVSEGSTFRFIESGFSFERGVDRIDSVRFEMHYSDPSVTTFALDPTSQYDHWFDLNTEVELALGGNARIGPIKYVKESIQAELGASGKAQAGFKTGGKWTYSTPIIEARGENQSWAKWTIKTKKLLHDDLKFRVIVRAPGALKELSVSIKAYFIGYDWLGSGKDVNLKTKTSPALLLS